MSEIVKAKSTVRSGAWNVSPELGVALTMADFPLDGRFSGTRFGYPSNLTESIRDIVPSGNRPGMWSKFVRGLPFLQKRPPLARYPERHRLTINSISDKCPPRRRQEFA